MPCFRVFPFKILLIYRDFLWLLNPPCEVQFRLMAETKEVEVKFDIPIWRFRLDYASAKIYAKLGTVRNTRWEEPLKLLSGNNGR